MFLQNTHTLEQDQERSKMQGIWFQFATYIWLNQYNEDCFEL